MIEDYLKLPKFVKEHSRFINIMDSKEDSPSLLDAKRQRKQLEQDANLLQNRIKLLQLEEQKTWKRIQDAKNRHEKLGENMRRKQEKERAKQELAQRRENERKKAQKNIVLLKKSWESGKQRNKDLILQARKEAYVHGKQTKILSVQKKRQIIQSYTDTNRKRSQQVKEEERLRTNRLRALEQKRLEEFKEDYENRVDEEIKKKEELERKVKEMEIFEMELIKKLQNTQQIQQQVVSNLEEALNHNDIKKAV